MGDSKCKGTSAPESRICANCLVSEESNGTSKLSACAQCGLAVYCDKNCQRVHWKANHKQHCIAKDNRTPLNRASLKHRVASSTAAPTLEEKCIICLDHLHEAPACTLPCMHVFHISCVEELRKFGVTQACPLCRAALPPGPKKIFEDATRRFVAVARKVERRSASWSAPTPSAQQELRAVITGWQAAADQGLEEAQFALVMAYLGGYGVEKDDKKAAQWLRKAAEQGYAEAQCMYGNAFSEGLNVVQSNKDAAEWLQKAAEQGLLQAQKKLATLYHSGLGVEQSDEIATAWMIKAAEQGDAMAQANLGTRFSCGCGVAQSSKEALHWWHKAFVQDNAEAAEYLQNVGFGLNHDVK